MTFLVSGHLFSQAEAESSTGKLRNAQVKNLKADTLYTNFSDLRLGFGQNYTDQKTSSYIPSFWNIHAGMSMYSGSFRFTYSFDISDVETIKKVIPLNNGDSIRKNPGSANGNYLQVIINRFIFAYELKLFKNWSFAPDVSVMAGAVSIQDVVNGLPVSKSIPTLYGIGSGCSITRYFPIDPNTNVFISWGNHFNIYNLRERISVLGDNYLASTIAVGIKFHFMPKSQRKFRMVENGPSQQIVE